MTSGPKRTPDWTVTTSDGVTLGARVHEPIGRARGDVLLLHAMMVDARTLDRPPGAGLASTLASAGWRVHRADLRGRGMSDRPADFTYDDLVLRDLPALVGAIGEPWLVGHSLGGHVGAAAWASGAVGLRGLLGIGANVWRPSLEPSPARRIAKGAAIALGAFSVEWYGGFAVRRWNVGSVDEPRGYASDLVRFWADDRWAGRDGRDWTCDLRRLRGPFVSVLSRGDRLLGHPAGGRAWASAVPRSEVWEVRDGDFGMARAPDHMGLVTDPPSAPIWRAIAARLR